MDGLGSKRGCFSSYDLFCLNGIHETRELRKYSALEYSITNLLRKDRVFRNSEICYYHYSPAITDETLHFQGLRDQT